MAKEAIKANWQTIDPASLSVPIQKQFERYRIAYREMKAERDAFETAVREQAALPTGKKLAIGYNFGKLSFAVVDDDAKPAKTSGSLSLSAFLAGQTAQGKRT